MYNVFWNGLSIMGVHVEGVYICGYKYTYEGSIFIHTNFIKCLPFYCRALEALSLLGGEDLEPFYAMLEGGRGGEFFAELEEYFYYAQIRR